MFVPTPQNKRVLTQVLLILYCRHATESMTLSSSIKINGHPSLRRLLTVRRSLTRGWQTFVHELLLDETDPPLEGQNTLLAYGKCWRCTSRLNWTHFTGSVCLRVKDTVTQPQTRLLADLLQVGPHGLWKMALAQVAWANLQGPDSLPTFRWCMLMSFKHRLLLSGVSDFMITELRIFNYQFTFKIFFKCHVSAFLITSTLACCYQHAGFSSPSSCLLPGFTYMALRGKPGSPGIGKLVIPRVYISFSPWLLELHCEGNGTVSLALAVRQVGELPGCRHILTPFISLVWNNSAALPSGASSDIQKCRAWHRWASCLPRSEKQDKLQDESSTWTQQQKQEQDGTCEGTKVTAVRDTRSLQPGDLVTLIS